MIHPQSTAGQWRTQDFFLGGGGALNKFN